MAALGKSHLLGSLIFRTATTDVGGVEYLGSRMVGLPGGYAAY
jgi:hypothetical protein